MNGTNCTLSQCTYYFPQGIQGPDSFGLSPTFLDGFSFNVPKTVTVLRLGVIFQGSAMGNGILALYHADGLGNLHKVLATASTPLVGGRQEIAVTPTLITPDKYWIFGEFSDQVFVYGHMSVAVDSLSAPVTYGTVPDPYPKNTDMKFGGTPMDFYLVGLP
jgi:hypothetical protein